jgi:hypothetical protein
MGFAPAIDRGLMGKMAESYNGWSVYFSQCYTAVEKWLASVDGRPRQVIPPQFSLQVAICPTVRLRSESSQLQQQLDQFTDGER